MNAEENKILELKNISHDLHNILSSIVNNVKLLKQNIDPASSAAKYAGIIENNSLRAAEIINEFLSNKKSQKRKINVSILFDDIVSSFANMLSAEIIFRYRDEGAGLMLFGNYTELFRALLNLLINAKEAVNGKGNIDFKIQSADKKHLIISVKDSGYGIAPNIIDKIFEPGFSTKDKNRESGMGLNIVKNIVEEHNGNITVKSELKKGSEFIISLPVYNEHAAAAPRNKKILIADDDKGLRESLSDLFESYGFITFQSGDGHSAIEMVNSESEIDLLIIDKKMPGKDGLQCIKEIRAVNNKIPIVLVTGVNFEESEHEEIDNQNYINKIVRKPYDFVYLKEIVEKLIL